MQFENGAVGVGAGIKSNHQRFGVATCTFGKFWEGFETQERF
jgi:hypothetical protein